MRLLPLGERSDKDEEVDDPNNGEPQVDIPLRLRILLGLRDAEDVARSGKHNEKLISPEHEPGGPFSG